MVRGETIPLRIEVEGINLDECSDIHVTLKQTAYNSLDLTEFERDGNYIFITLTQKESLKFLPLATPITIQVTGKIEGGYVWKSSIAELPVNKALLVKEV